MQLSLLTISPNTKSFSFIKSFLIEKNYILKNKIIDLETRVGPDGNSGELIEELNIKKETLSRLEREISELKEKLNGNEVIEDKEL